MEGNNAKKTGRTAFILLGTLLLSPSIVSAQTLADFFGSGLYGINSFLQQGASNSYIKTIDFVFFAMLFVSVYLIGAKYAFKELKRPEKAVAVLLGLMTAFLLVLAGISIGVLLPYVNWILYVMLFGLLYALLKGIKKKLLRFLLALLLTLGAIWLANALTEGFGVSAGGFDYRFAWGLDQLPSGLMSLLYALIFLGLFSFIFWLMGKIGLQNNIARFIIALLLALYLAWLLSSIIEGMKSGISEIKNPVSSLKNPFAKIKNPFKKMKNPFGKIDFSKITESLSGIKMPEPPAGNLERTLPPDADKKKEGQQEARPPPPTKEKPGDFGGGKKYWYENGKWYIDGKEVIIKDGKPVIKDWGGYWNTPLTPGQADSIRQHSPEIFGTGADSIGVGGTAGTKTQQPPKTTPPPTSTGTPPPAGTTPPPSGTTPPPTGTGTPPPAGTQPPAAATPPPTETTPSPESGVAGTGSGQTGGLESQQEGQQPEGGAEGVKGTTTQFVEEQAKKTTEGTSWGKWGLGAIVAIILILAAKSIISHRKKAPPFIPTGRGPTLTRPAPALSSADQMAKDFEAVKKEIDGAIHTSKDMIEKINDSRGSSESSLKEISKLTKLEREELSKPEWGENAESLRMDKDSPVYKWIEQEREEVGNLAKQNDDSSLMDEMTQTEHEDGLKADKWEAVIDRHMVSPEFEVYKKAAKKAIENLRRI